MHAYFINTRQLDKLVSLFSAYTFSSYWFFFTCAVQKPYLHCRCLVHSSHQTSPYLIPTKKQKKLTWLNMWIGERLAIHLRIINVLLSTSRSPLLLLNENPAPCNKQICKHLFYFYCNSCWCLHRCLHAIYAAGPQVFICSTGWAERCGGREEEGGEPVNLSTVSRSLQENNLHSITSLFAKNGQAKTVRFSQRIRSFYVRSSTYGIVLCLCTEL